MAMNKGPFYVPEIWRAFTSFQSQLKPHLRHVYILAWNLTRMVNILY